MIKTRQNSKLGLAALPDRSTIAYCDTPNPKTIKAMQSADKKKGKRVGSTDELFTALGI